MEIHFASFKMALGLHRALSIRDRFYDNGITKIEFPSHSPDLNAAEFIWGYLKHQISKYEILNIDQLQNILTEIWDDRPKELEKSYVDHIPDRIQEVMENRGRFVF